MGRNFYDRKPVGDTILGKIAKDYALRKAGLLPEKHLDRDKINKDWKNTEHYINSIDSDKSST